MAETSPVITMQSLKILTTLAGDPEKEWYGLELSKRVGLQPGTIYPIFDRFLKAGWVERRWEDIDPTEEGRPKRRLYRLTRVGEVAAREAIEEHLAPLQQQAAVAPKPRLGLA